VLVKVGNDLVGVLVLAGVEVGVDFTISAAGVVVFVSETTNGLAVLGGSVFEGGESAN
jgi:hypothetical protein